MTTTSVSSSIDEIMTAREAEQVWGLASGTVRAALVRGIIDGRKSVGTWLVTRAVMVAHYGPPNSGRGEG